MEDTLSPSEPVEEAVAPVEQVVIPEVPAAVEVEAPVPAAPADPVEKKTGWFRSKINTFVQGIQNRRDTYVNRSYRSDNVMVIDRSVTNPVQEQASAALVARLEQAQKLAEQKHGQASGIEQRYQQQIVTAERGMQNKVMDSIAQLEGNIKAGKYGDAAAVEKTLSQFRANAERVQVSYRDSIRFYESGELAINDERTAQFYAYRKAVVQAEATYLQYIDSLLANPQMLQSTPAADNVVDIHQHINPATFKPYKANEGLLDLDEAA